MGPCGGGRLRGAVPRGFSAARRPSKPMPIPESSQPEAFKAFEHERWQSAARVYSDAFVRLTSQVAEPLLDAVGAGAGIRLLDMASGPGQIAALAAKHGATVTGSDFSAEMVALARELHPGVDFRVADAEALPFEDGSFDAVTMGFLLGHLPRPAVAIGEAFRVLRPNGRIALSWWLPPDRCMAFGIMKDSIAAHGRTDVALPPAPPFEMFAQAPVLHEALSEAGFSGLEVRELAMTWRLASADEMFDAYRDGTARTAGLLRLQTPEALDAIRAEVVERCEPWTGENGLELPMPAWVASGTRL